MWSRRCNGLVEVPLLALVKQLSNSPIKQKQFVMLDSLIFSKLYPVKDLGEEQAAELGEFYSRFNSN